VKLLRQKELEEGLGEVYIPQALSAEGGEAGSGTGGIDKKASCHILRHSFATHMLENGVNIRVLLELPGHSTIVTIQYNRGRSGFSPKAGGHNRPCVGLKPDLHA